MQVHTFATFSNPAVRCQTPNVSLLQRLSCQVKQKIHGFFFGSGTGSPVQDNLVEVVRRNPVAASSLLRTVSWFSAVGNLASATSCGVFLWLYWTSCATCDRPLRCWLLLQSFLQVLQLPVRLVLLHTMRHVEVSSGDFQEWITSLTSSQAWQMSKKVAVFQYGWFVLGMVWWVHTDECPECPSISKLMVAVMSLSVARASIAVCLFRGLFTTEETPDKAPAAVGASHAQIKALPAFHMLLKDEATSQEPCSICLCSFAEGALMRRLPCGHQFHCHCIDKWLRRNKRCPLCMRAIDETCSCSKPDQRESCKQET